MLSEQVKAVILDEILANRYKPGDRLVESKIARDMGISQSPVREALRDLVTMRYVELIPHKGARVRRISRREVLEIYPVRATLEELAGNLAASTDPGYLEELERLAALMAEALKAKDAQTVAHWDVEFHRTILMAAQNQILIEAWDSLRIEVRTLVTLRNLLASQPDLDIAGMHQPIIDALREGDPETCGRAMRDHVEEFGRIMRVLLPETEDDGQDSSDDASDWDDFDRRASTG